MWTKRCVSALSLSIETKALILRSAQRARLEGRGRLKQRSRNRKADLARC